MSGRRIALNPMRFEAAMAEQQSKTDDENNRPTRGPLITGHPAMLTALGPHLVPLAS